MSKKIIKQSDINLWQYGYLDPSMRTFLYEGTYYRAVKPTAEAYVQKLFRDKIIDTLNEKKLIPTTEISELGLEGYTTVLKQQTEFFSVLAFNFPPSLAKDAALMYLDLCATLCQKNLGLIDGHAHNVIVQENSKPKWCDIGSIIPLSSEYDLVGLDEFVRYFVYPLLIRSKNQHFSKISRFFMSSGCSHEEAQLLLGNTVNIAGKRQAVIGGLQKLVEQVTFPWEQTLWSDYHKRSHGENLDPALMDISNVDPKALHVRDVILKRLFRTFKPKRVIDFGANSGIYSMLIGQTGAEVLAYELDEQAASVCHENFARADKPLNLKVALSRFEQAEAGKVPDLAMALALTHHLYFSHHFKFDVLARKLAGSTTNVLITEFMPNGLGIGTPHIHPMPQDYTLEYFTQELGNHFKSVEVVDYVGYAHRKLIIARKEA